MKNKKYLIYLFSLLALATVSRVAPVQAAVLHELNEDHHIRVVLPEETLDQVKMAYPVNGNDVIAKPADGEIASLSILDDMLNPLIVPFTARRVGDDIVIQLGDPAANSLKPAIGFHSTLEASSIDKEAIIVITAPGASAEVVYAPDSPQLAPNAEVANQFPMAIDDNLKFFELDGTLDIKFVVKPATDNGTGGNDGGTDGGNNLTPDDPASTGGCSFSATGTSFGSLTWSLLIVPLYFAFRGRRNAHR